MNSKEFIQRQDNHVDSDEHANANASTDHVDRADVAAVLTELRDALAADKMHGAVGRVQSAMHQLGVEY